MRYLLDREAGLDSSCNIARKLLVLDKGFQPHPELVGRAPLPVAPLPARSLGNAGGPVGDRAQALHATHRLLYKAKPEGEMNADSKLGTGICIITRDDDSMPRSPAVRSTHSGVFHTRKYGDVRNTPSIAVDPTGGSQRR